MRKRASVCGIVLAVIVLVYFAREELFSFVTIGKLPFTSFIVPATFMLIFWFSIIPLYLLTIRTTKKLFWSTTASVGKIHQKAIDRHYLTQKRQQLAASIAEAPSLAIVATWLAMAEQFIIDNQPIEPAEPISLKPVLVAPTIGELLARRQHSLEP